MEASWGPYRRAAMGTPILFFFFLTLGFVEVIDGQDGKVCEGAWLRVWPSELDAPLCPWVQGEKVQENRVLKRLIRP